MCRHTNFQVSQAWSSHNWRPCMFIALLHTHGFMDVGLTNVKSGVCIYGEGKTLNAAVWYIRNTLSVARICYSSWFCFRGRKMLHSSFPLNKMNSSMLWIVIFQADEVIPWVGYVILLVPSVSLCNVMYTIWAKVINPFLLVAYVFKSWHVAPKKLFIPPVVLYMWSSLLIQISYFLFISKFKEPHNQPISQSLICIGWEDHV